MLLLIEALGLFHRMKETQGASLCLGNLGESYRELGQYEKSLEYIEQGLALSRDRNDRMFVCAGLNDKGLTLLAMGKLDRALEMEEASVAEGRAIGHPWYLTRALQSLADVLIAMERYDEAPVLHIRPPERASTSTWTCHLRRHPGRPDSVTRRGRGRASTTPGRG